MTEAEESRCADTTFIPAPYTSSRQKPGRAAPKPNYLCVKINLEPKQKPSYASEQKHPASPPVGERRRSKEEETQLGERGGAASGRGSRPRGHSGRGPDSRAPQLGRQRQGGGRATVAVLVGCPPTCSAPCPCRQLSGRALRTATRPPLRREAWGDWLSSGSTTPSEAVESEGAFVKEAASPPQALEKLPALSGTSGDEQLPPPGTSWGPRLKPTLPRAELRGGGRPGSDEVVWIPASALPEAPRQPRALRVDGPKMVWVGCSVDCCTEGPQACSCPLIQHT